MIRLGKFGTAAVLGLALGLAVFTTGAFAQSGSQSIDHANISVSAHAAVAKNVMQEAAGVILGNAIQRPNGASENCGNGGWGNGCRGFNGCGQWNNCFQPRSTFRCASQRECRTVQVCRWTRWGRVCQGFKTCRFRSICRRCFDNGWNGGWNRGRNGGWGGGINAWGVKKH